jgi:hypothetical protein
VSVREIPTAPSTPGPQPVVAMSCVAISKQVSARLVR